MSKDRDGIAGDPSDGVDDSGVARAARDGDAAVENDNAATDALTDPESEIADADEVEAAIEAAEESADVDTENEFSDDEFSEDELSDSAVAADEDDLEDADAEDADEVVPEAAMATAGAGAGSARAAARGRAPVRAATTTKKTTATKPRETVESSGPIGRLSRFLREVVAELRKVIWPSRKQMVTYTIVVIVFLAIMVALVAGLDVLFLYLAGALFA